MFHHDITVIGASAGGVEALSRLVKTLPADLPMAIFVVLHVPSSGTSVLPKILNRAGHLPAFHPSTGEIIQHGQIYVAPPDHHLIIQRDRVYLNRGPRENGHRPAIDTLFGSAAYSYGRRVIGVILSGTLDDGTMGLALIRAHGGMTLVQDPEEATFDGMPRSAIKNVAVDHILKLNDIASCLSQLAHKPIEEEKTVSDETNREADIVAQNKMAWEQGKKLNNSSPLTCPDCGGVLWEVNDSNLIRFRCHVGHTYSLDSLLAEQTTELEKALWSATRALEERAALARRMAVQAKQQNRLISEAQFSKQAQEAEYNADLVRQVIFQQHATKVQNEDELLEKE
jgi:two-component system chemotaxis response regulator CheB